MTSNVSDRQDRVRESLRRFAAVSSAAFDLGIAAESLDKFIAETTAELDAIYDCPELPPLEQIPHIEHMTRMINKGNGVWECVHCSEEFNDNT